MIDLIALLSLFCYLFYICVFHGFGILVTPHLCFSPLPTLVMYHHRSSKGFRKALLYNTFTDAELGCNPPTLHCIPSNLQRYILVSRYVQRVRQDIPAMGGVSDVAEFMRGRIRMKIVRGDC